MAIRRVTYPAVIFESHMDLRFVSDDPNVMSRFWDEMSPELTDTLHEAMIGPAYAMGFHITVIDSGPSWIKWRVTEL